MERKNLRAVASLASLLIFLFTSYSEALEYCDGRVQLKGYLRHQSVWRSDDFSEEPNIIQFRTTLRLESLIDVADRVGPAENLFAFVVFEPFYDGVFDFYSDDKTFDAVKFPNYPTKYQGYFTRPGAGLHGGDRDEYAYQGYENTLWWFKEYSLSFDIENLNLRIGKQIVTWGRSDIFRLMDIINPQDYSWHFIFEGVEETRIPLHLVQGIYSVGDVGPFADTALEAVYNPGDISGDYLGYEGLPWNVIPEPGMHHWQRHDRGYALNNTEAGFRIESSVAHVNFTLNYWNGFVHSFVLKLDQFFQTMNEADIIREYPRAQWFGFTAEYDESRFTKAVWRTEFLFVKDKPHTIDVVNGFGIRDITSVKPRDTANAQQALARHPSGIIDRDVIEYVIGIDRNTWIKFLNSRQTFVLSTQLFGSHILNRNGVRMMDGPYPTQATEFLWSFATWSTYMFGRLTPWAAYVYDFTSDAQVALLSLTYLHGNHWEFKVGANLIAGRERNLLRDTSSIGGLLTSARHNDEFYVRLQYQF